MNTFENYVLYINNKTRSVYFLNQLPFAKEELFIEFPLFLDRSGRPHIYIDFPHIGRVKTLIDTGAELTSLNTALFDKLTTPSDFRVSNSRISGASGSYVTALTWIDTFTLAGHEHQDIDVYKSSSSLLCMDVLSQYAVTLDFIEKKMYLKRYKKIWEK